MLNNINYTEYNYQNLNHKLQVQQVQERIKRLRLVEQIRKCK